MPDKIGQAWIFDQSLLWVVGGTILILLVMGVTLAIVLPWFRGVRVWSLLRAKPVREIPRTVAVGGAVTIATWPPLQRHLLTLAAEQDVILDLSGTSQVDSAVLEKLHELEKAFDARGHRLKVIGLHEHSTNFPPLLT